MSSLVVTVCRARSGGGNEVIQSMERRTCRDGEWGGRSSSALSEKIVL